MKAGSRGGTVVYQELLNTARSVLMVAKDLEDPQRRLVLSLKHNLTAQPDAVSFAVQDGVIQWGTEPRTLSGEDYQIQAQMMEKNPLIREETHELHRAMKLLKDELTVGRATSNWMRPKADYIDLSYGTLRRAFKILGCKATKQKNLWFWGLPDHPESASEEKLAELIGAPDGELCAIQRETMPIWLKLENEEEEERRTSAGGSEEK
jgi:hypothetical protein